MADNRDYSVPLKSCMSYLESTKASDRKKGANELSDLLKIPACVQLVHEESDPGVTWDNLFNACHTAILRENEKNLEVLKKGKAACPTQALLFKSVILDVPKIANKGVPRLGCSRLISRFQNIYSSKPSTYLQTYVTIIIENVLSQPLYWSEIDLNTWNDLLRTFMKLFKDPTLQKVDILKAIEKIIKNGCEHSQFLFDVRKNIFTFLEEIVQNEESNREYVRTTDLQIAYMELCSTVFQQLGGEMRATLCKFGESIIPAILQVYEARNQTNSPKKNIMFKLILMIVNAHHPKGASKNSGACAVDWEKWRSQLFKLWNLINQEVSNLQINSFFYKSEKKFAHKEPFVQLAVGLAKQVLELESNYIDITVAPALDDTFVSQPGPSSKRRRLEIGLPVIIAQLRDPKNPLDIGPWLVILGKLISKYPSIIKSNEFLPLMRLMSDLLNSCNKELPVMDDLCRCCSALLTAQKFIKLNFADLQEARDQINAIWETTLRTVGLNLSEAGSHCLLRSLLSGHYSSEKAKSLLKMYVSETINLSTDSISTLDKLISLSTPIEISARESLLRSLSAKLSKYQDQGSVVEPDLVAKVIMKLITRGKFLEPPMDDCPDFFSVEQNYLLTAFQSGLFTGTDDSPENNSLKVETKKVDRQLSLLFSNLMKEMKLPSWETSSPTEFDNNISFLMNQVILHHHLSHHESSSEAKLLDNITDLLETRLRELNKHIVLYLEGVNSKKDTIIKLESIIKMYEYVSSKKLKVSKTLFEDELSHRLITRMWKFLKCNVTTIKDFDDDFGLSPGFQPLTTESPLVAAEPDSLMDVQLLQEEERLKLLAIQLSMLFLCSTKEVCCPSQAELITDILATVADLQMDETVNLQIAIYVLEMVDRIPSLYEEQIGYVFNIMQSICRIWKKNEKIMKKVVSVLACLPKIIFDDQDWEQLEKIKDKFFILINGCDVFINKDIFGSSINSEMINLIANLLRVNAEYSWSKTLTVEDDYVPLPHKILHFLKNPYHHSRLCAAKYISVVFGSSLNNSDTDLAFNALTSVINDVFMVSNTLTGEEAADEGVNRTATALHAIASVVCCSESLRKRALFLLLKITVEKKLKLFLIESVLKLICKYLGTTLEAFLSNHFYYLIWNWYSEFKEIDNFPYKFLNCDSPHRMYLKFTNTIVCLLFLNDDQKALEAVSGSLSKSVTILLEESFSELMAILLPPVTDKSLYETQLITIKPSELLAKIKENFEPKRFQSLLSPNIPGIVLNFVRILGPESTTLPPIYRFSAATDFFNYLQKTSNSPKLPIFSHLCEELPEDVQRVMLYLMSDIHKTSTKELKILALKRFQVVCKILGNDSKQLNDMAHYILKWTIYTLLHFLRDPDGCIVLVALNCLEGLVDSSLPHCAPILSTILPPLTSSLIPLITSAPSETGNIALKLLENQILKCSYELEKGILLLDPFPALKEFDQINRKYQEIRCRNSPAGSLGSEIKHFLEAGSNCKLDASTRLQGLKHLCSLLSIKKDELALLYTDLNDLRGFSEECAESILHRLICMLVELASSPNELVKLEAAKCLGELGAADLNTLTLFPEEIKSNQTNYSAEHLLLSKSLELLINSITDENIHLVKVASDSLYLACELGNDNLSLQKLSSAEREFIYPFLTFARSQKKKKKELNLLNSFDAELFYKKFSALEPQLTIQDGLDFHVWLKDLIASILDAVTDKSCFLFSLKSVCFAKLSVGEELLPFFCYLLLSSNIDAFLAVFNEYIKNFFASLFVFVNNKSSSANFIFLNHKAVKLMLKVVHFIRLQQKKPDEEILDLNFLHLALASQYCSAHFSSIFYAELWWSHLKKEQDWKILCGQSLSSIEYICEQGSEEGIILQNLLRQAYTNLGDVDAVKGCGSLHLLNPDSRVEYYQQTGQWQKVLEANDLHISNSYGVGISADVVRALKNCGLYSIAGQLVCKSEKDETLSDALYEISWRLSNWSVDVSTEKESYESWHYAALKSLHGSDVESLKINLKEARLNVLQSLSSASLQSSKSIYPFLSKLHRLQEIEDVSNASGLKNEEEAFDLLQKWKSHVSLDDRKRMEFEYLEPLLSQRAVIFLMFKSNLFPQICLDIVRTARVDSCFHVANRHLKLVSQLPNLNKELKLALSLEEAQLVWAEGDAHVGRILMRAVLKELKSQESMNSFKSDALRIYGSWMADTNSESAQDIVDKYLFPATKLLGTHPDIKKTRLAAYDCLARYSDLQYQNIQRYIKSDVFQNKKVGIERQEEAAKSFRSIGARTADVVRAVMMNANQSKKDNLEVENTYRDREKNLFLAMQCYLKSLIEGDCENMRVFRVVGLWLENTENDELMKYLLQALERIPSYKFISVLPQLMARLSKKAESTFEKTLFNLIEKCAIDHPHHTLPMLFALANSYKDRKIQPTPAPRVIGAQTLIQKLRERATLSSFLKDMDKVCDAYISLANLPIDGKDKGASGYTISRSEPISKLKNITSVLCPTITLAVNKTGNYSSIVGIHSIDSSYSLCGGVNAPKKITCVGTDGIKRFQLVKGQDDLRQDAVMQQVFSIMNKLFRENKDTSKRKLLIRTYKIVPMAQRSGVIEWCMNTQPLTIYLTGTTGRNGAHSIYRPNDATVKQCREKIEAYHEKKADNSEKLRQFNEICQKIQPVFRYFFYEYFPSPGIWFERKTAYIHSVAASSMVGYILGIGDRHVVNILIDNSTAEVIHIDFGIAFEQGMILPRPETVPFRLTRDIEDGMGVSGTEGVFKTCCEKTMSVLRANQEIILTILEVLLYDPLYSWALTPEEAANFQTNNRRSISSRGSAENSPSTQADVNKTAERALARLRLKLQGMEEEGTATSIEGQVNRLIQQAKDPLNLSQLFQGWQAYL